MFRASACKATSQVSYAWTILAMPHVDIARYSLVETPTATCRNEYADFYMIDTQPVPAWAKLGAHAVRTCRFGKRRILEHILSRTCRA
jgi:hypothetical protein